MVKRKLPPDVHSERKASIPTPRPERRSDSITESIEKGEIETIRTTNWGKPPDRPPVKPEK